MENKTDTYRTISKPSKEILFKERKSKFYGYAFPIQSEAEVKSFVEELRRKHHTANHVCYAWQLGVAEMRYRANDDGEPNNSAGMPIYGQLQAFQVTNILVAVVRIFGGTKLGVGGLIAAYRTAAQMALEAATIIQKVQKVSFRLSFSYPEMDKVMRVIKQHKLEIVSQEMKVACLFVVSVRKGEAEALHELFHSMHTIKAERLTT